MSRAHALAKACRNGAFIDVFRPDTGAPCGGLQEHPERAGMEIYRVLRRQSWCASGYLAMVAALQGDPSQNPAFPS